MEVLQIYTIGVALNGMTQAYPLPQTEFFRSAPPICSDTVKAQTEAWMSHQLATSSSVAVGSIMPSPKAIEAIAAMDLPPSAHFFEGRGAEALAEHAWPDPAQRTIFSDLGRAFLQVIEDDCKRADITRQPYLTVNIGRYQAGPNTRWHIDGGQIYRGFQIARWAVAWGVGATRFAHGIHSRAMFDQEGVLLDQSQAGTSGHLTAHHYPLGTVSRFMTHLTIHSAPEDVKNVPTARIFMTASTIL